MSTRPYLQPRISQKAKRLSRNGDGREYLVSEKQRNRQLQKRAQRVWEKAAPHYGASPDSKAPKIWQAPNLPNQDAETVTRGFDGAKRTGIKLSPKLAAALLNPNSKLHNTALETLLHEDVHANQPDTPVTRQNEWKKEGGAEALARRIAPKVYKEAGIPYHNPRYEGYPGATRRVNRQLGKRYVEKGQLKPLAGSDAEENPHTYDAAFHRNERWAKAGPYQTKLLPRQEHHFQQWAHNHNVPLDKTYDMRGYWLGLVKKGKLKTGATGRGGEQHFPDAYKTPYDPSFSKWSKYAKPGTPYVWRKGNRLINRNTGRVVYG